MSEDEFVGRRSIDFVDRIIIRYTGNYSKDVRLGFRIIRIISKKLKEIFQMIRMIGDAERWNMGVCIDI